jgi:adenylylsulfate kinase
MIYWFTGQAGAGKTSLAKKMKTHLYKQKKSKRVFHIDGDELRLLFDNINYGKIGRQENIKRAQDIAKFINAKGHDVVVSLISPYKELREKFKEEMKEQILEIYVHTTNERGREQYHVNEYEQPTEKYIDIDTTDTSVKDSFQKLIEKL